MSTSISETNISNRLQLVQAQINAIGFEWEVPQPALKAICALSALDFKEQPKWGLTVWEKRVVEGIPKKTKFYVARRGEHLEITIPLDPIHKNPTQKTAMFAYRILFHTLQHTFVKVEPKFRMALLYDTKEKKVLVDEEINMRHHCNNLKNFPKLEEWGIIAGSREKKPIQKMMLVDECYSMNLAELRQKDPEYARSRKNVIHLLIDLLEAVSGLHSQFVHCDIKEENIILKDKWKLALTDLGLATVKATSTHDVRGSHLELAPELIQFMCTGRGWAEHYQPSLDIWNVGMIAYNLLFQVHNQTQWPEFRKHQRRLELIWKEPEKYESCQNALQQLFPQTWEKEKKLFLEKYETYSRENLRNFVYGKWLKAVYAFEREMKGQPEWLWRMLRVSPSERAAATQTLSALKAYVNSPEINTPLLTAASSEDVPTDIDADALTGSVLDLASFESIPKDATKNPPGNDQNTCLVQ